MKRILVVILILGMAGFVSCSKRQLSADPQIAAAERLCMRLMPRQSRNVAFGIVPCDTNFYSLETVDGKLLITGNNVNSLAVGLGAYLRDFCKTDVSTWFYKTPVSDAQALWNNTGNRNKKTNYDPCPPGWSVPIRNDYVWQWGDWSSVSPESNGS